MTAQRFFLPGSSAKLRSRSQFVRLSERNPDAPNQRRLPADDRDLQTTSYEEIFVIYRAVVLGQEAPLVPFRLRNRIPSPGCVVRIAVGRSCMSTATSPTCPHHT